MVKIYSSIDGAQVHNHKNALAAHGIECMVRGEERRTAIGELPPTECWAELWVLDDAQASEARTLIEEREETETTPWTCTRCAERIEGQFDVCWRCGAERNE